MSNANIELEDEYGMKRILNDNNVDLKILPLLNKQIDLVCGSYLMNHEQIRQSVFTELKVKRLIEPAKDKDV